MDCFDPAVSEVLQLGTKKYLLNQRNYLKNFAEWDEPVRDWLALREGLVLTAEHLHAIGFLREHFSSHKAHPMIRNITEELGKQFGQEKGTIKYFHVLFPGGIHQAFLIAGLPMQDSCC